MKKATFLTAIMFLFVVSMNAQSKKNEIDLGAGVWSTNEIVGTMSSVIVSGLTGIKMGDNNNTGAIHLGYKYALSERFALGPVFTYDQGIYNAKEFSKDLSLYYTVGKFTSNFYTLAVEGDYKYVNSDKFKLYSLAGVGATLLNQVYKPNEGDKKSQSKVFFNFQITPIAIKYGSVFGVFAELGFGYKGIVSAGLFYRF